MMDLCEGLIQEVTLAARGTLQIEVEGKLLDLAGRWPRLPLVESIAQATGIDVLEHPELPALRDALRGRGLSVGDAPTWAKLVDDVFSEHVEPGLVGPVLITDHPIELSPLAKRSPADPRLAERFEPYLAGMEIGNAFSELNDPDEQRRRFEEQARGLRDGDGEAHPLDEEYIATLEYGLPPTGGLGIGVDRLVMLLANAPNLREVILFPHLRPEGGS
jgi:lysyl-tRNA synthetase class 2